MQSKIEGKIITIVGNIGVGKTWICNEFNELYTQEVCVNHLTQSENLTPTKRKNLHVMDEPALDYPHFEEYYKDPKKYAFDFQDYMMKKRYEAYQEAMDYKRRGYIVLMDQSIFSDMVYGVSNKDNMSTEEYELYQTTRENLIKKCDVPDQCLYLDCQPRECLRRILEVRNRKGEGGIPLEYLSLLNKIYTTKWFDYIQNTGSVLIVTNWNEFPENVEIAHLFSKLFL